MFLWERISLFRPPRQASWSSWSTLLVELVGTCALFLISLTWCFDVWQPSVPELFHSWAYYYRDQCTSQAEGKEGMRMGMPDPGGIQWLKQLSQYLNYFKCLLNSSEVRTNKFNMLVHVRKPWIRATRIFNNYIIIIQFDGITCYSIQWLIGTIIWGGIRNIRIWWWMASMTSNFWQMVTIVMLS